jgi:hypothetical protein
MLLRLGQPKLQPQLRHVATAATPFLAVLDKANFCPPFLDNLAGGERHGQPDAKEKVKPSGKAARTGGMRYC